MNEVSSTAIKALKSDLSQLKNAMEYESKTGHYFKWSELKTQYNILLDELKEIEPSKNTSMFNEFKNQHKVI